MSTTTSGFPRAFGPYVLVAELGRGGMGEVYLAWSGNVADIAKLCVIKTMRPDVAEREVAHRRFLDEARVSVSLNHANICSVYDVGQVSDVSYIAMEYAGRRTLRDVQNRARELGAGLPEDVAIWLVGRVLEGLEHAHAARDPLTGKPLQIVHRDVSPQNVMVRHDGAVKLIDFGLARSSIKVEQTQTGMVAGKLTYMAPEQVRSEPIDARADQFAAAVMLYELVAGERYYEELREHEIWAAAARGGYRPRRWDVISPDLQVVLDVALAGDASGRFASCEAFLEALATSLKGARMSDARRFKQVMKELFPSGEDDERSFLQSLPEHSAVRAMVQGGTAPKRAPSSPSEERSEENTAALVSQLRPRRWPVLVAAAAVAVALAAFAAVALVDEGGGGVDPAEATAAGLEPRSGDPSGAEPATSAVKSPKRTDEEPRRDGDEAVRSERPTPREDASEPARATRADDEEPSTARPSEDAGANGKRRPDRKRPPRASTTTEEAASASAAEQGAPKAVTEIDRFRATLSRCEDPCAAVWRSQLAGRSEVPENARTSLRICLDRCQKEP